MNTFRAALIAILSIAALPAVATAQRGQGEEGAPGGQSEEEGAGDPEGAEDGPGPEGDSRQWWQRGEGASGDVAAGEATGNPDGSEPPAAAPGQDDDSDTDQGDEGDGTAASTESGDGDPEPEVVEEGWDLEPYGFIRAGYEYVMNDARYDFVGENDGFILGSARAGLQGRSDRWGLSFRISAEGAADLRGVVNSPEGELGVRMRDVYMQWDFLSWMGLRLGQFKVPFMAGWLGRDGALPFASRAVGLDGVPVGRGFETPGIVYDRELGLRLGSPAPTYFGDFGLAYYLTAFNGNGANEILNDNGRLALAGRVELYYLDWVRLGGGMLWNSRTEGPLPDRFDEEDLGFSADVTVQAYGVEFVGHFTLVDTTFETVANPTRQRLEFHLQGGYLLPFVPIPLVVNYRFAYYDPWQNGGAGGGVDLSTFELLYHTVGLRIHHPAEALGLTAWLNYTFTIENAARQVDNDRLEVIVQLTF